MQAKLSIAIYPEHNEKKTSRIEEHKIGLNDNLLNSIANPIDVRHFESLGTIQSESPISHTIDKGRLQGSPQIWYRKEFNNPASARREWLAQEFLRLIIPNQVETRLAYDPLKNIYYVLSKEVPGFKPLPTQQQEQFNNGTYTGLGRIVVASYFVHEADLKNGNVGLGEDNIVYKVDGDWSFASMRSSQQFPKISGAIAAVQINRLPFPITYKAHNWLDIFIEGSLASASDIVADDIATSPFFKAEKFETLFKLLLIPNSFFIHFVDSFIPSGAKDYSDFLIERHRTLFTQTLRIQGFAHYVNEHASELSEMAQEFPNTMQKFTIQNDHSIVNPIHYTKFDADYKAQLDLVFAKFNLPNEARKQSTPVKEAPQAITQELSKLGIFKSEQDPLALKKIMGLIDRYAGSSNTDTQSILSF